MTDKEKIRAEIERLKESGCASPIVICDTLLAFIDSLQEEPVSEELEDVLAFKDANPLTWASIIGPEIKEAYIRGKSDALKIMPKWEKVDEKWLDNSGWHPYYLKDKKAVYHNGYAIELVKLERLPKEEQQ